jgi:hypothetical protein
MFSGLINPLFIAVPYTREISKHNREAFRPIQKVGREAILLILTSDVHVMPRLANGDGLYRSTFQIG